VATSKQTIWRLIQSCAKELTEIGNTPFTRADLIKCVRRKNPRYEENSINPIIQGLTDNLRGGALGAVGKDILHSVGRGLFILNEGAQHEQAHVIAKVAVESEGSRGGKSQEFQDEEYLKIGAYNFHKVCDIRPDQTPSGKIVEHLPQERYKNEDDLPLNKYGAGPFCKFKIPSGYNSAGVYAIVVGGKTKYVGECENLSSRYNMGYGNISPRNCFIGGQETNCRINNLILNSTKSGIPVSLWFIATEDYKAVEMSLRNSEELEWNRV